MSGAILPLLQYALMAWFSVKKTQGLLYLYLKVFRWLRIGPSGGLV
jgi:hypothetical protein